MSEARKLKTDQPWQLEVSADHSQKSKPNCIGVSPTAMEPEHVLRLAIDLGFGHVCQKGGLEYDKEIQTTNNMILAPESFFAYPIATIFTPGDLSPASERALVSYEKIFDCSNQKRETLEDIAKSMQVKGLSQTIIDDVVLVADEMFTNAIFNAPFVDKDTHTNPGVSRHTSEIKLQDGKQCRVFLAHDESRLVIGCEDPYGSLGILRYLSKVKATYTLGAAATMNFGSGGAGLGSYIIFNTGASLYIGVRPGQSTVICCVLPLGMSNRKRAQLPKHLHWIQL